MGLDWQDILVATAIGGALVYVSAQARRLLWPVKGASCGAGCHGCSTTPGSAANGQAPPLVQIQNLRLNLEDRR